MRRNQVSLAIATALLSACAGNGDDEALPDGFVSAEQADLSGARLPADVAAFAETPLADADAIDGLAFEPAESSDLGVMLDVAEDAAPDARFGRDALVAIRWGYFPARPDATEIVDWSGFVAVPRGSVQVVRPLRFENDGSAPLGPTEDFVLPDADPRVVRFRSHTRPAADGLLLRVHRPSMAPSVVVIRVGGVTRVLAFEELFDLDASEVVTGGGHELHIRARTPAPSDCLSIVGEGTGTWTALDATHGTFDGGIAGATWSVDLAGQTLDVLGPYSLFRARALDDGVEVGRARGVAAAFHYTPGAGRLVGMARSGSTDARGGLLGRWTVDAGGTTGDFELRLIHRAADCAE